MLSVVPLSVEVIDCFVHETNIPAVYFVVVLEYIMYRSITFIYRSDFLQGENNRVAKKVKFASGSRDPVCWYRSRYHTIFAVLQFSPLFLFFRFEKEVERSGGVPGYRFTPPPDVFADRERNPENDCFCPAGPPCAPHGLFNVSLCQYGTCRTSLLKLLLSARNVRVMNRSFVLFRFTHFSFISSFLHGRSEIEGGCRWNERTWSWKASAVHRHTTCKTWEFVVVVLFDVGMGLQYVWLIFLYIFFQVMGVALRAKARIQINLAVSQVVDIKQVATFPDIVFPIMWFEDVSIKVQYK